MIGEHKMLKTIIAITMACTMLGLFAGCTSDGNIYREETALDQNWGRSVETAKFNQILNPEAGKNLNPVEGLSGPAAGNGELFWPVVNWVACLTVAGGFLLSVRGFIDLTSLPVGSYLHQEVFDWVKVGDLSAPFGLVPCPTLSGVIGFALLGGALRTRAWAGVLAGAGAFGGTGIETTTLSARGAIPFVADTLSALLLTMTGMLVLAGMVFARAAGHGGDPLFPPLALMMTAGVYGAYLTADLFNLKEMPRCCLVRARLPVDRIIIGEQVINQELEESMGPRVLIADADDVWRDICERGLCHSGFTVETAQDGLQRIGQGDSLSVGGRAEINFIDRHAGQCYCLSSTIGISDRTANATQ